MVGKNLGGKLQGVSLDSFLQMAQMEDLTCTLRVTSGDATGDLYLLKGELVSAATGNLKNTDAAHHIISWEGATIEIEDACKKTINEINQPLMNILMEGLRLRDEAKLKAKDKKEALPPQQKKKPFSKSPKPSAPDKQKKPDNFSTSSKALRSTSSPKRRKPILAALSILFIFGIAVGLYAISTQKTKIAYDDLELEVSLAETPEKKIALLQSYMEAKPRDAYAIKAKNHIKEIQAQKVQDHFSRTEKAANRFIQAGTPEKALNEYQKFQRTNPGSPFEKSIAEKIISLTGLMDTRNYNQMLETALKHGPERIRFYKDFLTDYPESRHRKKVETLISEMKDEYYFYISHQIKENEETENWQKCIDLSQLYIQLYPEAKRSKEFETYTASWNEKLRATQAFDLMVRQATDFGKDYNAAITVFSDYLKAYPKTSVKDKIEKEIVQLKALAEKDRLATAVNEIKPLLEGSGPRFKLSPDDTVVDAKTGLMWCLIDSQMALNRCVTYEEAIGYIERLNTGNHKDWRLPTPEELFALYDQESAFATFASPWYWTSLTKKTYAGQWVIHAQIVIPEQVVEGAQTFRESWQCGTVRAVRRPKE